MEINSLSDDDLTEVLSRLSVEALLSNSNICHQWIVPWQQACRRVTKLSLLGSQKVSLIIANSER